MVFRLRKAIWTKINKACAFSPVELHCKSNLTLVAHPYFFFKHCQATSICWTLNNCEGFFILTVAQIGSVT